METIEDVGFTRACVMGNERPLRESDLIFSPAASTLKYALGELKRSNLSITNRLQSITSDADFVSRVATAYDLPLVANERCGSWYIRPEQKGGSAYFKSTDGHFGQWSFSLRRLNLQIFDVLHQHYGCIIVDSTRRGKSIPDALSKTVPIWSVVLNRLLFPNDANACSLQTPPDVVSASEHSQIEQRLSGFVLAVRELGLDVEELRTKLQNKPLRVAWVGPNDVLPSGNGEQERHNLILLCTASCRDSHDRASSDYVQGAADDSESWAHGLNATVFWGNHGQLLSTSEDDLPDVIASLTSARAKAGPLRHPALIKPTAGLWIGDYSALAGVTNEYDVIIACVAQSPEMPLDKDCLRIHLATSTGKLGSRKLRSELCKLDSLGERLKPDSRILVTCEGGKDIAVGVSLALLCRFYDEDGRHGYRVDRPVSKTLIKHRLSWIMVSMPDASPSRATLQSVNAYLMGG